MAIWKPLPGVQRHPYFRSPSREKSLNKYADRPPKNSCGNLARFQTSHPSNRCYDSVNIMSLRKGAWISLIYKLTKQPRNWARVEGSICLGIYKKSPLSKGETLRKLIRFTTGQIAKGSDSRGWTSILGVLWILYRKPGRTHNLTTWSGCKEPKPFLDTLANSENLISSSHSYQKQSFLHLAERNRRNPVFWLP